MTSLFRWATALLVLLTLLPARRVSAQTWLSAVPVLVSNANLAAQHFTISASVTDATGNVYVVGTFDDTFTLDGITIINGNVGHRDAFVGKISPAGVWQWAKSTHSSALPPGGVTSQCEGSDIALDTNGDILITGSFAGTVVVGPVTLNSPLLLDSNLFVAKLSPAGIWQWVANSTTPSSGSFNNINSFKVSTDSIGNVFVTGSLAGTTSLGGTTLHTAHTWINIPEAFVAKLSPGGAWQWAAASAGSSWNGVNTSNTKASSFVVDAAGNTTIVGLFNRNITFGNYTLTRTDTSSNRYDLFVSRISPAGVWQWATQADSPTGGSDGFDVALSPAGSLLLTGYFSGPTSFGASTLSATGGVNYSCFLAALTSSTGSWQWVVNAGGPSATASYGQGLVVDAAGRIVLGGLSGPPAVGQYPMPQPFVAMYSANGAELWRTRVDLHGQWNRFGFMNMEATGPDEILLTGIFTDTASFGTLVLSNANSTTLSMFINRLSTRPLATPADHLTAPLTLAPNPAHETVQLTGAPAAAAITLLDALGRTVRTYPTATTSLDVRGLTPGLYSVRAGSAVRRLVVE